MEHRFKIGDRVYRSPRQGVFKIVLVVEAIDDSLGLPGYRVRPETPIPRNRHSRFVLDQYLEPVVAAS